MVTIDNKLLYADEVYAIQGAAFEVYREVGAGFLEAVYHECLQREFLDREIPFAAQPRLQILYKGKKLEQTCVPDLVCYGKIIIELKAAKEILPEHKAQLMNYLKVSKLRLGLILNFGHYPKLQTERIIL